MMRPLSFDIQKQDLEIEAAKVIFVENGFRQYFWNWISENQGFSTALCTSAVIVFLTHAQIQIILYSLKWIKSTA